MDETLLKWLIRFAVLLGALLLIALLHLLSRKVFSRLKGTEHSLENKRSWNYATWGAALVLLGGAAYYWVTDFELAAHYQLILLRLVYSLALLGLSMMFYGFLPILFKLGNKSTEHLDLTAAKRATLNRVWQALLRIFVFLLGLSAILSVWNIDISRILTGLGIGSLAVALAAQNLLSNLIGGATLMLDKPFEIGDSVKLADLSGTVEEIGWRSTRLRSFDDEVVTLPNAKLMDSNIVNLSRMGKRRVNLNLDIGGEGAEDKINLFCERMRMAIKNRSLLIEGTEPLVAVQNLRFGGYQILLRYYIKETDYALYVDEQHQVLLLAARLMDELGLKQVFSELAPGGVRA